MSGPSPHSMSVVVPAYADKAVELGMVRAAHREVFVKFLETFYKEGCIYLLNVAVTDGNKAAMAVVKGMLGA